MLRAFISYLLILSPVLSVAENVVPDAVIRALAIRDQVRAHNEEDIRILRQDLMTALEGPFREREVQSFFSGVVRRLSQDAEACRRIRDTLSARAPAERGSIELRTSLGKLVGTAEFRGIFENARRLLENRSTIDVVNDLLHMRPRNNDITVLKTVLTYVNLELAGARNLDGLRNRVARLRVFYPVELPSHLIEVPGRSLLEAVGLYQAGPSGAAQLLIPNAGYIFGGNFFGENCRGVDCSAFVARCTQCSVRPWTGGLAEAGRFALRRQAPDPRNREFVDTILREFEVINLERGEPRRNDMIVWVHGAGGHAAIFEERVDNNRFWGIDDNREDDFSVEGIDRRMLFLTQENRETFCFRRRQQ